MSVHPVSSDRLARVGALLVIGGLLALMVLLCWPGAALGDTQRETGDALAAPQVALPETSRGTADLAMTEAGANSDSGLLADASHTATLRVDPTSFCPGWLLRYSFQFTNTDSIAITNLVITSPVPGWASGAWVDATSPLPGILDPVKREFLFKVASVAPGQRVEARTVLHSYSTVGGAVVNTFYFFADQLDDMRQRSVSALVDQSLCEWPKTPLPSHTPTITSTPTTTPTPTNTLTPTLSPTPTLTPTDVPTIPIQDEGLHLPLILNCWVVLE